MKLRFTPRALENVAEIANYIRARNPAAAQRVRGEIYSTLQNLILFRLGGRGLHHLSPFPWFRR